MIEKGQVHLARPFRSTAICRKRMAERACPTDLALTCRVCIRRGSAQIHRQDPDYARVTLSQAERKRARLPLNHDPIWDLLDAAVAENIERQRGGPA